MYDVLVVTEKGCEYTVGEGNNELIPYVPRVVVGTIVLVVLISEQLPFK